MKFETVVSKTLSRIKSSHGIRLQDSDLYVTTDGGVYIKSHQVAAFFKISYHYFTVDYVKPLIASGVRRITLGRTNYYDLKQIEKRLEKVVAGNKNIFAVCAEMAKTKKTKKKKAKV